MIQLETNRLLLREFTLADVPDLFELNNDPDVVKYTGDSAFNNIEEAENMVKNYNQYKKYKMGRLNMYLKETGEFLGWCGLKYLEDKDAVDIGYRLKKAAWGKGYATEAAEACLDYGFNVLGLEKIIGSAMKENVASIRVFDKLGLSYLHDENCGCQPGVVYVINQADFNKARQTS